MRIVLRKIPQLLLTLFAVSFLTYLLIDLLPGDPALQITGFQDITAEQLEAVRAELGLNEPLPVRYLKWVGNAATGDLGRSFRTSQPVMEAIRERLPVTLEIGGLAIGFALLISIPLGTLTAYRAGGIADKTTTGVTFGLLSVPSFMMALLLIYIFAVWLEVLPATGWVRLTQDPVGNFKTAMMPALALSIGEIAAYTRLLRTDMIATLQEDFVIMARAKGIPTWRILLRHALRPSSFSLMTVVGLNIGALIGGSVVVETIFAVPGVGRLLVDSIYQRDLLMVQGVVLFIAAAYVIVNFLVDLLYSALDPRIRHGATTRSS